MQFFIHTAGIVQSWFQEQEAELKHLIWQAKIVIFEHR
jgi:hypothetical protein